MSDYREQCHNFWNPKLSFACSKPQDIQFAVIGENQQIFILEKLELVSCFIFA